jgi:hypothetical protein
MRPARTRADRGGNERPPHAIRAPGRPDGRCSHDRPSRPRSGVRAGGSRRRRRVGRPWGFRGAGWRRRTRAWEVDPSVRAGAGCDAAPPRPTAPPRTPAPAAWWRGDRGPGPPGALRADDRGTGRTDGVRCPPAPSPRSGSRAPRACGSTTAPRRGDPVRSEGCARPASPRGSAPGARSGSASCRRTAACRTGRPLRASRRAYRSRGRAPARKAIQQGRRIQPEPPEREALDVPLAHGAQAGATALPEVERRFVREVDARVRAEHHPQQRGARSTGAHHEDRGRVGRGDRRDDGHGPV